jgi:hypothetical protein
MIWLPSRISIPALLVCGCLLAPAAAPAQDAAQAPAVAAPAEAASVMLRGTVKSGNVPLPGATVIAVDVNGKKFSAATDESGSFQMSLPANMYNVRASLAAFASVTQTIQLTAGQTLPDTAFTLQLASREQVAKQSAASAAITRGIQSLSLLNSGPDAAPAAGTAAPAEAISPDAGAATDSVAVTGQVGSTNALGNMSEDEIRQRVQDAIADARAHGAQSGDIMNAVGSMIGSMMSGGGPDGGGFGGGSGGHGGGGSGGHGSFRNFNPTQPHGAIFYSGGNSALNTRGFYANGPPPTAPSYNSNNYGVTLAGSPYIPGLFKPSTKQFVFLNFTGMKSSKQSVYNAIVPTDAERNNGDFSGAGNNPLYVKNSPTPTNVITCNGGTTSGAACITPQAKALLAFYPTANATPGTSNYNYQRVVSPASDSNTIAMRYIRNFGQAGGMGPGGFSGFSRHSQQGGTQALRQNLNGNFNYQHAANDIYTAFPSFGGRSSTNSLAFGVGYTIGYGRLTNNVSLSWNRTHALTRNYFTDVSSPANTPCPGAISGPCFSLGDYGTGAGAHNTQNNPLNYGIPGVLFAQFTGFSDTTPADKLNQTITFSESSSYNKHKHNVHFGFDFHRIHLDTLAGTNVLGSYTFTGNGTCQQVPATPPATGTVCAQGTGSDFADFLLGLPQQAAIQASNYKYYLRANAWDFFAQDDWRLRPNLTLNYGLRYEYFSPYAEKYNHLANLDHNAALTGTVAEVYPNSVGALSGMRYPNTLVNPDRNNFSPRVGFAWKPGYKFAKNTVVRGGYGVNYNTGQYSTFALRLASEPPFADTQTNIAASNGCPTYMTWSTAFNCSNPGILSNNYAVNLNYRLGYVQIWNLGIQQTLPFQTVLNIDYTGSKGTRLDIVREPNRGQAGLILTNADSFNYEDSLAGSHLNALAINLRQRLQHGVALGVTYTYSHSIDNASSIGGTATVVAQNDQNLHAEEGNSSFDVRHKVNGTWLFELPFGPNTMFLNSNDLFSRIVAGWSLSGNYTFATGTPLTPHYSGDSTEVGRGSNGSYRPNRVPGSSLTAGGGSYLKWFNTSAFVMPPGGGYGNASRNSIPGPGTVSIDAALSKTIQLGTTRSFEMRASANNVFNTVQYSGVDTNLNSRTYGQVTSVSSSRQITVLARYRF